MLKCVMTIRRPTSSAGGKGLYDPYGSHEPESDIGTT
jgi:hypothetical protein